MPASKAFVEFVRSIFKNKSNTAGNALPSEPALQSSDKVRALPGVIVKSRGSGGYCAPSAIVSPASTSSERVVLLPGVIIRKPR